MAKTKGAKALRAGKAPKQPKVKKVKVKGALMDRVTNLVAVLFALSLAAERVVAG